MCFDIAMSETEQSGNRSAVYAWYVAWGILCVITSVSAYMLYVRPWLAGRSIRVDVPVGSIALMVNPNTADFGELTALPEVGPAMAERIIAFRRQHQAAPAATGPAFRSAADLQQIRGIGPKTVERLTPYLTFEDTTSGDKAVRAEDNTTASQGTLSPTDDGEQDTNYEYEPADAPLP